MAFGKMQNSTKTASDVCIHKFPGTIKPGFHLDFICLLLLVLVFRTNKKPQRAMRCSNGNIHEKPKRAAKSHNEQQKTFACFGF